ncbi:MAG: hypothetical protein K2P70_10045 [Hyphomonadaceae bacterium]|nr:hypothetical protein [Hyphomonadaceae bacterium]
MTRLVASAFASALAVLALGGAGVAAVRSQPAEAALQSAPAIERTVPRLDYGQCRIHYDALPSDRQPAQMECEHAEWLAQRWGGKVLEHGVGGVVERASYEGRNDFTGVPENALPRAGYCRAWLDDVAVSAQPEESDCRSARRLANASGGRVIYMPL